MNSVWKWIQARFRLNLKVVCEMSKEKGLVDYHDYTDTKEKYPDHFCILVCERCGKEFTI